jgi:hypothetical protein
MDLSQKESDLLAIEMLKMNVGKPSCANNISPPNNVAKFSMRDSCGDVSQNTGR